ncbi:MAG: YfcE family phosphodiesterase [Clostridiales bacterium]|nr:YfcE family phosphodiesterase [Clostridiales bacterium]
MRIIVISDSHRAKGNLFEIVEKHMNSSDLFIFLGDGEDDFDSVLALYPDLKYERVAGNCDWYSTYPLYKSIKANGKTIFFSHGHPFHVKFGYDEIIREARSVKADICLFGHTHNQYTNYDNGLYIMNPGSVADGRYGIIDIVSGGIDLNPQRI